ncbi:MAG: flagellar hook-associated protein FlgK [Armatimonadia bacterium]
MSFQTLEIARTALAASRVALEVASQNVANANTPGYVRQRVVLAPMANRDTSGSGMVGGGVDVITVQRLRDQCLEAQINNQEGRLGEEKARAGSLTRVQTYFSDLSETGISAALGEFFNSLQRVQTTPESVTAREEVLFAADSLCQQMHTTTAKLQEERSILESDLQLQVTRANQVLQQVAELNGTIATLADSPQANDLRVMREEAIRELGGICGAGGLDMADGSQDVLLGGIRLVQGSQWTPLSLVDAPADPTRHVVEVAGIVQPDGLAGTIAGDMTARDTNLAGWQGKLDELAATIADAVNAQHRAGYDLDNAAGGDLLEYDAGSAARTLRVSAELVAEPRKLAAAGTSGGAPGDGTNAAALAGLRAEKLLGGATQTLEEFQAGLLYDVGVQTEQAQNALAARKGFVVSLDAQYANQAGVSLDEEAVDVMKYQQAYTAALKLIQMVDEMTEDVLGLVR